MLYYRWKILHHERIWFLSYINLWCISVDGSNTMHPKVYSKYSQRWRALLECFTIEIHIGVGLSGYCPNDI